MNHEILFRLARAFAKKGPDQLDQIRAQLLRFSWIGQNTEFNQHKLYGWLTTGVYQVLAKKIDQKLLEHFLEVARELPKVSTDEPFLSDYAIFPEIERISFIAGLVFTDLMAIDSGFTDDIVGCIGDMLESYYFLLESGKASHLRWVVLSLISTNLILALL